jgi:hypothetical protein
MGELKQKQFTNNYSCWTNSVSHIHNMAIHTFGKGYTVQQRRIKTSENDNLRRKQPFLTASVFTSGSSLQNFCNIGQGI